MTISYMNRIECKEGFSNGQIECPNNYIGTGLPNVVNYSILMDLNHMYCNQCCKYCCCHPKPENVDLKKYFNKDFEKMFATIEDTTENKRKVPKEYRKYHFEIWGGEPLFNFDAFTQTFNALREHYPTAGFSTSSNGLVLKSDSICDFLIKNNIKLQLSHDALGQRMRGADPLKDEHTKENIIALSQMGILTTINTTLSQINPSWYENMEFWDKSGLDLNKMNIKLNHISDSNYPFEIAFTDEKIIRRYMEEFMSLYWACYYDHNAYLPYRDYILEQGNRWQVVNPKTYKTGCRAYHAYKYNQKDWPQQDWHFTITTTGEYAECNLCKVVDRPDCSLPDYCKDCKYNNQAECYSCGSMDYPRKCIWKKAWIETLEIIHKQKEILRKNGCNCKCNTTRQRISASKH